MLYIIGGLITWYFMCRWCFNKFNDAIGEKDILLPGGICLICFIASTMWFIIIITLLFLWASSFLAKKIFWRA